MTDATDGVVRRLAVARRDNEPAIPPGAQPQPLSRLEKAHEVHYLAMDSARAMYLSCSTFGMSFQRTVQPQTRT